MNHHEPVTDRRPHTREFSQRSRDDLGLAVRRAREAAALTWDQMVKRAGIGRTSLFKLEKGEPVGAPVYEAVARGLPGWTEDTPLRILEGAEPPATGHITAVPQPKPDPERIDVAQLIRKILDGEPEPEDVEKRLDIRDDFEAEMIGLNFVPLLQRLTLIQIRRTGALKPSGPTGGGSQGRQTSA